MYHDARTPLSLRATYHLHPRYDDVEMTGYCVRVRIKGAFDRQIVARRTFHRADRNATARTLMFPRDAETSVPNFTRTHFPIVAPVNPLLQFKPCQVEDRTVLVRF